MFSVNEDLIVGMVWGGILIFCGVWILKLVAQAFLSEDSWLGRVMAHVTIGPADFRSSNGDGYGSDGCNSDGGGD